MIFNTRSNLAGTHAFLSASNYHWINYDEDKFDRVFVMHQAAKRGTELHDLAKEMIRLGVKLEENEKTLNRYVNDAIGFRMTPEPILYYSDDFYGTPDAIAFRKNRLRIHDLKTGVTETSMHQLEVYAALFCLEFRFRPFDIEMELRIYQNDEVRIYEPDPDDIFHIMEKGKLFSKRAQQMREETLS